VSDPIEIVKRDGQELTFKVKQTWKSWGKASLVATDFINAKSLEPMCDKTRNVAFNSESPEYKVACNNGLASVDVYVLDSFYSKSSDDANAPSRCDLKASDRGRTSAFYFTVPCSPMCADNMAIPITNELERKKKHLRAR
jgi:hypothetical protein